MKRWHEELPIFRRRFWSYEDWLGRQFSERTIQYGRYRKRKPLDCGNSHCHLCHCDKFPKRFITYREWEANLKFQEGLADL